MGIGSFLRDVPKSTGLASVLLSLLLLRCAAAGASSDPLSGLADPGGVAIGLMPRIERSPYRSAGMRHDFVPVYLYEGEQAYLHSLSLGLKFGATQARRF